MAFGVQCSLWYLKVIRTKSEYIYFLQVVPTIYKDIRGRTVQSNQVLLKGLGDELMHVMFYLGWCPELHTNDSVQYSVTEHFKNVEFGSSQFIPGVFFFYDLSPVKVGEIYLHPKCSWNKYYNSFHCKLSLMEMTICYFLPHSSPKFICLLIASHIAICVWLLFLCIVQVTYTEEHVPFLHFITHICAIVGGIILSPFSTSSSSQPRVSQPGISTRIFICLLTHGFFHPIHQLLSWSCHFFTLLSFSFHLFSLPPKKIVILLMNFFHKKEYFEILFEPAFSFFLL